MTQDETNQVQAYIAKLQAEHTKALQDLHAQHALTLQNYQKTTRFAQSERNKMETAVATIANLSETTPDMTAHQLKVSVKQILAYYCPDYNIPF